MTEYQGNSKKSKEKDPDVPIDKGLDRVVVGEVIIKKRSVGRRFKDIFVEADMRTVIRYVTTDILIPAAKNVAVDSVKGGIDRLIYGDAAVRRRSIIGSGPRTQYHNPMAGRPYSPSDSILGRIAPPVSPEPRQQTRRYADNMRYPDDIIVLPSRDEAELVLERLEDALDKYQMVSLADFKRLIGHPQTHVDYKWGWTFLGGSTISQVRDGWILELPPAEPIQQ